MEFNASSKEDLIVKAMVLASDQLRKVRLHVAC